MGEKPWELEKNHIMHQMLDVKGVFGVKSPYTMEIWVYCHEYTIIGEISSIMNNNQLMWSKYNDKRVNSTRRVKINVNWYKNPLNVGGITPIHVMSCGHGENRLKKHESMQLCPKAIKYCMEMVNDGEIPLYGCESCIINWLCSDCDEYHHEHPYLGCYHAKYG